MKNMEREKFEDSWKEIFEKAEVSPSENVWTNIELELEKQKGGQLKRRLMFYQMLAAASVVFAMALGSIAFFYGFQHQYSGNNISLQNSTELTPSAKNDLKAPLDLSPTPSPSSDEAIESNPLAQTSVTSDIITPTDKPKFSNGVNPSISRSAVTSNDKNDLSNSVSNFTPDQSSGVAASSKDPRSFPELPMEIDDTNLSAFYHPEKIELEIPAMKEVDPVMAMLAKLEMREKEVSGEKNKKEEKSESLWTSIGFAAGSYNTVRSGGGTTTQASSASTMQASSQIADQEANASGFSYSMGVNVGTRLAERWVLQGGVNYLTQSSDYTSSNAVVSQDFQSFKPASTNELVKAENQGVNDKIIYTAPYNINNSMRYLSIPMQAGYLLVNKTFGFQLNAGVATDLFLQNTVKADGDKVGGKVDNTTQSSGSDSPYRSVNLSGLFGTEFSYRFGPHYRVALNPGIRYPFNTIYKSNLGVQASPFTFDVGLRFRYIFH